MNLYKFFIFIFSIVVVTSSWAMLTFDSTLYNPALASIKSMSVYLTLFLSVIISIRKGVFDKKYIYCLFPIIAYWLITTVHRYAGVEYLNLASYLLLCSFVLLSSDIKRVLYKVYYLFFTVISLYGIVCYASYALGLSFIPFRLVEYYTTNADFYIDFYACSACLQGSIVRFCGLYNEPGLWGTMAALILCVEDLQLKKISNLLILIAGACCFSLAFWAILIIYYILSRKRYLYTLLVLGSLLLIYIYVLPNIQTGNEAVDALIGRLAYEDGGFSGDNRSHEHLDYLYENVLSSSKFFLGYGGGYIVHIGYDGSLSYKTYIVEYGFIGFLLMYGSLFAAVWKYVKPCRYAWAYIAVFFISIYQRPGIFSLIYMVVLFGGLDRIKARKIITS